MLAKVIVAAALVASVSAAPILVHLTANLSSKGDQYYDMRLQDCGGQHTLHGLWPQVRHKRKRKKEDDDDDDEERKFFLSLSYLSIMYRLPLSNKWGEDCGGDSFDVEVLKQAGIYDEMNQVIVMRNANK